MTNEISLTSSKTKNVKDFFEKYYYIFYFVLLAIIAFACFYKLGTEEIRDFDEARHGANAYEMLRQNNFIANYYGDELDYWNLKPPISMWLIILGYKIFGYNAFGLRFFSGLSFVLIVLVISLYMKKNYGKIESLISILICGSFTVLFINHCVRSGDADSVYMLFFTVGLVSLLSTKNNPNWIFLTGFMFSLMFLTKSFHSLVFVPIVFFYLLFTKGFKRLKWWRIVIFFVISIIPILIWAVARYNFDGTTFLKEMIDYDLLSRSSTQIEEHDTNALYYFLYLFAFIFPALVLSIVSIISKIRKREKPTYDEIGLYTSFLSIIILFTIAQTRIAWYIFPCVIPLAIYVSANFLKISKNVVFNSLKYVCSIFIVIFFAITTFWPFTIKNDNTMQNFINSIEITEVYGKSLYTEYDLDENGNWRQSNLLCAELKLDSYVKNGGWNSFIEDDNAYIIVESEFLDETKLELVTIVYENNGLSLCTLKT